MCLQLRKSHHNTTHKETKMNDKIIDIPKNRCNITTVEAEYDRAMIAEGEAQRKDPVGHALHSLEHHYKHNKFSSCYSYADALNFYMTQPEWDALAPKLVEKGLPDAGQIEQEHHQYMLKLWDKLQPHLKTRKRAEYMGVPFTP